MVDAGPNVLNHNMESIARLYDTVRPQAKYERSLELLRRVKDLNPDMRTKSGLMVGLGKSRRRSSTRCGIAGVFRATC